MGTFGLICSQEGVIAILRSAKNWQGCGRKQIYHSQSEKLHRFAFILAQQPYNSSSAQKSSVCSTEKKVFAINFMLSKSSINQISYDILYIFLMLMNHNYIPPYFYSLCNSFNYNYYGYASSQTNINLFLCFFVLENNHQD